MEEQHAMKVIARIRSDFTEKFGIPRQSGLVEALEARIVFEPEYRNPDAVRGMEGFHTSGSSGSFPARCGQTGAPPCARRGWAATSAWGCLPPARPSGPMPSGFPA